MNASEFVNAYAKTSFWVDVFPESRFAIRCGERNPRVDELLEESAVSSWAYVTACNPRSNLLPPDQNAERMTRLRYSIEQGGYSFLPGEGVPDQVGWPSEPSYLILEITESDALSLARLFEQNAIVVGSRGACARLLWAAEINATVIPVDPPGSIGHGDAVSQDGP